MNHLADWLSHLPEEKITPEIIAGVISFAKWCEEYPRGKVAGDDLYTILVVGFYENLFRSVSTRKLLPKLIQNTDMVRNGDYLRTWVGADNYENALKEYRGSE